jgi:hypothetical protein
MFNSRVYTLDRKSDKIERRLEVGQIFHGAQTCNSFSKTSQILNLISLIRVLMFFSERLYIHSDFDSLAYTSAHMYWLMLNRTNFL